MSNKNTKRDERRRSIRSSSLSDRLRSSGKRIAARLARRTHGVSRKLRRQLRGTKQQLPNGDEQENE